MKRKAKVFLNHIDFSAGDTNKSMPFHDVLLTNLGYKRLRVANDEWRESKPTRAAWEIRYNDGTGFGIDLRPAISNMARKYDRYQPGPHHMAFNANSHEEVGDVFRSMTEIRAEVWDEPFNCGGKQGYGDKYYAVFFTDPDGFKVEVVHARRSNAWSSES